MDYKFRTSNDQIDGLLNELKQNPETKLASVENINREVSQNKLQSEHTADTSLNTPKESLNNSFHSNNMINTDYRGKNMNMQTNNYEEGYNKDIYNNIEFNNTVEFNNNLDEKISTDESTNQADIVEADKSIEAVDVNHINNNSIKEEMNTSQEITEVEILEETKTKSNTHTNTTQEEIAVTNNDSQPIDEMTQFDEALESSIKNTEENTTQHLDIDDVNHSSNADYNPFEEILSRINEPQTKIKQEYLLSKRVIDWLKQSSKKSGQNESMLLDEIMNKFIDIYG